MASMVPERKAPQEFLEGGGGSRREWGAGRRWSGYEKCGIVGMNVYGREYALHSNERPETAF